MQAVRRLALVVLAGTALAGCGGSITDIAPRSVGPTVAPTVTPFCDAVEQSEVAAQPLSRLQAGQRVPDVEQVVDRVRTTNAQLGALSPPELRADVDLVSGVVNRQLRLLEESDGDTLALARDQELNRASTDPAYSAAARRISDYVRRTC